MTPKVHFVNDKDFTEKLVIADGIYKDTNLRPHVVACFIPVAMT